MRLYLAGPMRGYPLFNFPAFHAAAAKLRSQGHEVWSPAEADEKFDALVPSEHDPNVPPHSFSHYMKRDLPAVCDAEAVAVLSGWEQSEGAKLEVHVGRKLGKQILDAETLKPVDDEVRVTDPSTGGQKGQKLARYSLIPSVPLWELAEVYGRGAKKYADDNWRLGYDWKLSFDAMQRHAWTWWGGSQRDELGNHHLAQVAWHAFTLMWFELHRPEKDTRQPA